MLETIQTLNHLLGISGILGIVVMILIVIDFKTKRHLEGAVKKFGLIVALLATVGASGMTLLYSEYFGILPCGLCWLERAFLYPQVFLLSVALYNRDKSVAQSGLVLSIVGLVISLYHHYLQMGGTEFIKCPAVGAGISCTKRYIFEFGFITFPLLSALLFGFLIILYLYIKKSERTE